MPGVEFADGALDCVRGADAVVLVTEWDEFRALDLGEVAEAMAGDAAHRRAQRARPRARSAPPGLVYEGVGRG